MLLPEVDIAHILITHKVEKPLLFYFLLFEPHAFKMQTKLTLKSLAYNYIIHMHRM